jgi:ubiquinone biosynthesis protein
VIDLIRKKIRHIQRYREIVNAFIRYGFGFIIKEMGLHELLALPKRLFFEVNQDKHTKTTGERIRLFLEDLGPTFVKMGQIASTRYDLIPKEIVQELEKLQDNAPPFSFDIVKETIELELEHPLKELFSEFSAEPLAAASIGQVHYAVLQTGEKVAIKIQRPNMRKLIETDLEILRDLAMLAEQRLEWAGRYRISDIVEEFSRSLREEIDYVIEGRNSEKIEKQFVNDPKVVIPKVYWEHTTKKVLTMEYVEGVKLYETDKLEEMGNDNKILAKRIVDSLLHQILIEGYFHGDPHPGNILALPGNTIIFLDFGMIGRLSPEMKHHMATLVIALMRQKSEDVIKSITDMGIVPAEVKISSLRADVDKLYEKYYDVPLSRVSLGHVVNDLFMVAYRHSILIPPDLTLLGKTLLTMEGIVVKLDPEISILKVAEPFGRRLFLERFYPKKVAGSFLNQLVEVGQIFGEIPKSLKDLNHLIKNGKMRQEISFPEIDHILSKLNQISNRISFSIGLLAISIVMMGLIIGTSLTGHTSALLTKIPVIEIGFVGATLMFFWLLISIFKSGKF